MLIQVHDELVFESPADSAPVYADMIREEMANALPLVVPVKVDVGWGSDWLDGKA